MLLGAACRKKLATGEACNFLYTVGLCAKDYIDRPVDGTLSGGELKRIELATSLAKGGEVFLLDEPEAGIDLWSFGFKEKNYLNAKNFDNDREKSRQISDLIRKIKRQLRINGRQHGATSHYMDNYGYIPLWIGVKVISFGLMSEMFSILKDKDREEIDKIYDIEPEDFEVYLSILSNYRNLCAHEDIVFDHFTQRVINDTKYHNILNIDKDEDGYIYGKNDIFALIIILKRLLTKVDFKMMMNEINYELDTLNGKLKSINIGSVIEKMGFPKNYKDIMYIE